MKALHQFAAQFEPVLAARLPIAPGPRGRLMDAMRHGALEAGKRVRPYLLCACGELFGAPREGLMVAGAALECVHAYSLVHDDLPAMDDSDTRRGKPSVHKAFDEAAAVLAGDALLTLAFEIIAEDAVHPDPLVRLTLSRRLAQAAGWEGMAGGQAIDLAAERGGLGLDLEGLRDLQARKTGALIVYAAEAGARIGGASPSEIETLTEFASRLGLLFQITDDLLDVEGDAADLGKPVGHDAARGKATFVSEWGIQAANQEADRLLELMLADLAALPRPAPALAELAAHVRNRRT